MGGEEVEVGERQIAQPEVEISEPNETGVESAPESVEPEGEDRAEEGQPRPTGIESLKPGMQVKGKVRNVVDFGAFIDIGVGRDGLAHISTLKRAGIDQTIKPGDELDVVVRRINVDDNRISLTIPNAGRQAKISLRNLEVDSVVTGRVVRLVDFGAFVDIGARSDGLLHISQLPYGYVNHPSEVLKPGDEVRVRILEVDPRKRRISLTMKGLDQDTSQEEPNSQEEESSSFPTAFEIAFERARKEARRRRSRSRE